MPRDHLADERDRPGMLVPDAGMDYYSTHVAGRATLCLNMWLRAAMYAQGAGITPRSDFFSDKAEAQTGRGVQGAPGGSFDAAHLMNTTFRPAKLDGAWRSNPRLRQIYVASSATTMQFATSNRSSDKVIDSVQTQVKNELYAKLTKSTPIDLAFVQSWLNHYLVTLLAALKAGNAGGGGGLKAGSYQAAYAVTATQIAKAKSIAWDIYDDISKWSRGE